MVLLRGRWGFVILLLCVQIVCGAVPSGILRGPSNVCGRFLLFFGWA